MTLDRWKDDSIQFPRLLCEIMAEGCLREASWDALLASMDLESDDLSELFDRANDAWEKAKIETEHGSILREFMGGSEIVDFAEFAEFVVQAEDVAADIAKELLDYAPGAVYEYNLNDLSYYERFSVIDKDKLAAQLKDAEETLASWQDNHGAEQTGLGSGSGGEADLRRSAAVSHQAEYSDRANVACPTCHGTGGGQYNDCPTCDGNGIV